MENEGNVWKSGAVLCSIFAFMYLLNYLLPLTYGDDYLFQFVWDSAGGYMYRPIPEGLPRVRELSDIASSVWAYYLTWGGRSLACFLVYFFLWMGKPVFDVANSLVYVLLVLEIYWLSEGGRVEFPRNPMRLLWIFFALWTFCIGFSGVVFWVTGACHYLWMIVLLLAFLLPIVRYFMEGAGLPSAFTMFFLGLLGGWTNENTVCWVIVGLSYYSYHLYRKKNLSSEWIAALTGLTAGYALMLLAPGNFAREAVEAGMGTASLWSIWKSKLLLLLFVLLFQTLLWYFLWRNWGVFHRGGWGAARQRRLCAGMALLSILSLLIMLLSPAFPLRTAFGPTVFLIAAVAVELAWMKKTEQSLRNPLRVMLRTLGTIYMALTMAASVYGFLLIHNYGNYVDGVALQALMEGREDEIVTVHRFEFPSRLNLLSGFHLGDMILKEDENDWHNVAYARYWEIRGIRAK